MPKRCELCGTAHEPWQSHDFRRAAAVCDASPIVVRSHDPADPVDSGQLRECGKCGLLEQERDALLAELAPYRERAARRRDSHREYMRKRRASGRGV
jgi:hypothetical protein